MSVYSREQINEIKEKLDFLEFYRTYLPELSQRGRLAWCCCPWHNEIKPSFSVDTEYGMWRCWGENISGDVFAFYMKQFGTTFDEAIRAIAKQVGVELVLDEAEKKAIEDKEKRFKANDTMCKKFQSALERNVDAYNYLTKIRGVTQTTIDYFRLGVGIKDIHKWLSNDNQYNRLKELGLIKEHQDGTPYSALADYRVIIPRINEYGKVASFTGRAFKEITLKDGGNPPKYLHLIDTPCYKKSEFIFGLYQAKKYIKKFNSAILCEGEFDLIRAYQKGIVNTVCVSGLNISDTQVNMLKKYTDTFYYVLEDGAPLRENEIVDKETKVKEKVTPLDKLYRMFKKNIPYVKFYIIDLRAKDGGKRDMDMYLEEHNKNDFKELIQHAKIYNEFIIGSKVQNVNPKNIEEKSKCLAYLTPILSSISNFMDRKQYIELVANKLMISENDVYRKIKFFNENKDKLDMENLTWDSRPVYAQKILLSMCFCPNFKTYQIVYLIKHFISEKMEPFYKNIFNDYILKYIAEWYKNNDKDKPVDFTNFFTELNCDPEVNELVKKTILNAYFKVENLEDFDDNDAVTLIKEQEETLDEYVIPTTENSESNLSEELEALDI